MKKHGFGLLALALMAANAGAQAWVAELDDTEVRAIRRAADGDIVLVGNRTQGGESFAHVRKLTPAGTPVSAFRIGTPGVTSTVAADAVTAADGKLVICGYAETGGTSYPWISAWDLTTGSKLWQTTPAASFAQFAAVAEAPGGYVAVGTWYSTAAGWSGYAAGFDDSGNLLWQRTYDPATVGELHDVISTGDGGAVMTASLNGVRFVIRIDPSGNPIWSRSIHLVGSDPVSVTLATDGSLFVSSTSWGANDPWISRWTTLGDVLWKKEYNTNLGTRALSLEPAPDGGVFLYGAHGGYPTVLRIDADGEVFWHRRIAHSDTHPMGGVLPTPEGGCFIGWSQGEPAPVAESWLARLGAWGDWSNSCTGTISGIWTGPSNSTHTISPEAVLTGLAAGETSVPGVVSTPTGLSLTLVCGEVCTDPPRYCTTLPNSVGPGATIRSSGSTSVFANDLVLEAMGLPAGASGLFFYGTQPTALPFGDGIVCVSGQTFRLPVVQSDAAGFSDHPLDVTAPPSAAGQITPGSTFYFQHWYRDVPGGPAGFNFTHGLAVTFCP